MRRAISSWSKSKKLILTANRREGQSDSWDPSSPAQPSSISKATRTYSIKIANRLSTNSGHSQSFARASSFPFSTFCGLDKTPTSHNLTPPASHRHQGISSRPPPPGIPSTVSETRSPSPPSPHPPQRKDASSVSSSRLCEPCGPVSNPQIHP